MDDDQTNRTEDPTVLEVVRGYFKSPAEVEKVTDNQLATEQRYPTNRFVFSALLCFLAGQFLIEFLREALGVIGIFLVLIGFLLSIIAFLRDRNPEISRLESDSEKEPKGELSIRLIWLVAAFATAILSSFIYKRGSINLVSGSLWLVSISAIIAAFYQRKSSKKFDIHFNFRQIAANPAKFIAYLLLITVVFVFQLGKLDEVPPEIISAQVEALYTVDGISYGDSSLWFPRNVISEPISYYWAAIVNRFSGGSSTFTGLKLAYALAGLVAVFFMYKLGRRLFDEKSGYVSAFLLGVGYWPILQQRAVLGFGLVLPIMLPALYYLFKSLQEDDLNSLLISSILTGLGLLTNKIFFVLVFANLTITMVYLLRKSEPNHKNTVLLRIGIGLIVGIVVILPLVFVIAANPDNWIAPIINRISTANNPDTGNELITFFNNLISAAGMFNWSNRSSWVDGIGNRAALDWVSGAFFLFGLCLTLLRDLFNDRKQTLSLCILFIIMLLPSVFSIAHPMENPSLSRAIGSAIPAFLIAGRGFSYAVDSLSSSTKESQWVRQAIFVGILGILIMFRNFGLINSTYVQNYRTSSWNATEMAAVIRNFDTGQASNSQAYVVGYPHWVDARSVAISMDQPYLNLSILPQDLASTLDLQTAKIFLLHINDTESLSQLQSLYPGGVATIFQSTIPEKNFLIYIASQ